MDKLCLTLRYLACSVVLIFFLSVDAFAWGDYGHRLTARIAARFLNPQAQSIVADLLNADIASNPAYYQSRCPSVSLLGKTATLTPAQKATYKLPASDPNYAYVDKKGNPLKGGYRLGPSYYVANAGVVNEQLQNGGLRLGRVLNETLVK